MKNYNYPGWENVFVGDLVVVKKKQLLFKIFKVAYKHDNFIGMDTLFDYEDSKKVGNNVAWRKDLLNDKDVFIFPHNSLLIINNLAIDFTGVHDKSKCIDLANLYSTVRKFTQSYYIAPADGEDHNINIKLLCESITNVIEMRLSLSSVDDVIYYNMITDEFISIRSVFDRFININMEIQNE